MIQLTSKKALLFVGDIAVFFAALYGALCVRTLSFVPVDFFLLHVSVFSIVGVFLLLSLYIIGLYDVESLRTVSKLFSYTSYSAFSAGISGVVIFYLFPSDVAPKLVLFYQILVLTVLLFAWRFTFERWKIKSTKVRALLIGEGAEYEELKRTINQEKVYPLYFTEHVTLSEAMTFGETEIHAFHSLLKKNGIRIIVADIRDQHITKMLPYLYNAASDGILLYDMRRMYQDIFKRMPLNDVGYFWFFDNVTFNTKLYVAIKRAIDVIVSIPLLLLVALIYPFVAIAIKREDGGDVFIKQERLGGRGKIIRIYKFRTMTFNDAKGFNSGGTIGAGENRVTRVGAFLRKTRLDEFPQAFSILKGDLSLIGPRTELVEIGRKMTKEFPYYMIRYSVKPGLSGWAQVSQDDGSPRGIDGHLQKLEYDFYYIKHRSFFLDTIIALRTVRILLSRSGV